MSNIRLYNPFFLLPAPLLRVACSLFFAIALLFATFATPARADELDAPEIKEATSAALLDKNGNVLFELNATERNHPASITKVMTAMVVLDSGHKLDEMVTLTAPDLGENSQMGDYATGDQVTLNELLQVMLVYSGNDAAWNAACLVAGNEEAFVELMNKKAAEIGMEHTHFENSHGLEGDDHYSCAYDLALMGRYALEHYPYIAQTAMRTTTEAHVYGDVLTLNSTDRLLETYDGIRGIKTGAIIGNYTFLGASGRGDKQLYSAVLGCETFMGRFDDTVSLMDWGFSHYGTTSLTKPGWVIGTQPHAYEMGMRSVISTTAECQAPSWPTLGGYSFETMLPHPSHLLATDQTYGWTLWRQAGSSSGYTYYQTRKTPAHVSSWQAFTLPLFEDVSLLGEVPEDV